MAGCGAENAADEGLEKPAPAQPSAMNLKTPDSEAALADAMIDAVSDPVARLERGSNARQMIERDYDWRRVAGYIDRIYSDVLAQRRR